MIRRVWKNSYEGNYLTAYEEVEIECDICMGERFLQVDREELRLYLIDNNYTFREAMKIYRQWKATGCIPCHTCEGVGTEIEKF